MKLEIKPLAKLGFEIKIISNAKQQIQPKLLCFRK
jgi:hypothetical protein